MNNQLKPILNDTPEEILIIHTGALGDVICALTALKYAFPQKTIDFCCQSHIFPVLQIIPNIRNVYDINTQAFTLVLLTPIDPQIQDWLKTYSFILLISFSKDWENGLYNYNQNIVRIPPRPPIHETVHISWFLMDALQRQNMITRDNSEIQNFILQKKTRSYNKFIDFQWKSVSIHPGSGSTFKNWPIERYLSVSKQLQKKTHSVGWILGPAENALRSVLIQNHVNHKDIVQTNHIQTIMQYLKQSAHFVGNDSGISHLSAYLGVDTTVIFGPSDIRRWRPIGTNVKTIPEKSPECEPCFEKGIRQCSHKKCFNNISVAQVINKIEN
jgi:ADP-heptose:LPS heptosyltransferase